MNKNILEKLENLKSKRDALVEKNAELALKIDNEAKQTDAEFNEIKSEIEKNVAEIVKINEAVKLLNSTNDVDLEEVKTKSNKIVKKSNETYSFASEEYKNDFFDYVQTGNMVDRFKDLNRQVKFDGTTNNAAVIPTILSSSIISKIEEQSDLFRLISKSYVNGYFEISREDVTEDATWGVAEGSTSTEASNSTDKIQFAWYKYNRFRGWS